MTDLTTLIARLETGSGEDRELDGDIEWEFSEWENMGGWWRRHKVTGQQERYSYTRPPPVTSSLDAALAFAAGVLPGWGWLVRTDETGRFLCNMTSPEFNANRGAYGTHFPVYAPTAPRAVLIATLKALQSQAPSHG